jgi:hypothetical protein
MDFQILLLIIAVDHVHTFSNPRVIHLTLIDTRVFSGFIKSVLENCGIVLGRRLMIN